ncbi:MAG: L-threonine 3-dehydrogenase [Planctomycetes bacterium]|nr:L-threonine 3-dehydrogenase [Planctomycetota bacterium]
MPKMKAIQKPGPREGAQIVEAEVPTPGPHDLLIRVRATSVCGTDLHIYKWDAWAKSRLKPPLIFGHECCGEVVQVGASVRGFALGDYVSAESHIPCGYCFQCRTGLQHICSNLSILGVDVNGCFADYVTIPATCAWKNDPSLPVEIGSILEPMGNAVYATLIEDVSGRSVAVFGCGPTGLFSAGIAKASGASVVIAIDLNPGRMELARKMGADEVIAGNDPELADKVARLTGDLGVDVVLEMSGAAPAIRAGFKILKKGGRFTAFGLPTQPVELDFANDVIFKGARVFGINGREMFTTWYKMIGLLKSGRFKPDPVITHKFRLEDFEKAFAAMQSTETTCGKVVLLP